MQCFVDWLHQGVADLMKDRPRLPEALYITKREADSLPEADPTNHFASLKSTALKCLCTLTHS